MHKQTMPEESSGPWNVSPRLPLSTRHSLSIVIFPIIVTRDLGTTYESGRILFDSWHADCSGSIWSL